MGRIGIPSNDDTALDGSPIDEDGALTELARPEPLSFTRGMNPRAMISWVRHVHGDAGVRQLAAALPQDMLDDLGGPALRPSSMAWIPFLTNARLIEAIDAVFGKGDYGLMREVGRYMARHDFPAVAKPMAMMLSPGLFIDLSVKIWRLYHSHGHWEVIRHRREIQASLFERPESHRAFCEGTMGWIEGAMIFCGAVDVVAVEERCAAKGAPCCSIRVRWAEARDAVVDRTPRPPT